MQGRSGHNETQVETIRGVEKERHRERKRQVIKPKETENLNRANGEHGKNIT